MEEQAATMRPSHLSLRDLRTGNGEVAYAGTWATIHYTTRLLGDDTVIESTHTSGYADRDYGQPLQFAVGDMCDAAILRVLHPTVLDMKVGGVRRVRTTLGDASWGYRKLPQLMETRSDGRLVPRRHKLQSDYLMDVEVSLVAVQREPPPGVVGRAAAWIRGVAGL